LRELIISMGDPKKGNEGVQRLTWVANNGVSAMINEWIEDAN